ncbi:hypothetical protein [Promicromonospora iranensis]|uniref:Glycosyl transferase family 1 n=1 Tax=Promicromonospora iranensis TaxID=1105144 RepID=A0ABU2CIM0_9MICO|nr:hypothetical protein [Promicromonospora iranensis]MDR7381157.1 hypothetical protein [Promicromonospora iranensis]
MRIGYSFWGFLGPGITDTPDGGRSHRRVLVDGLLSRGNDVVFLQADRDRLEAGHDLTGTYRWDEHLPEIDALFLEWRWPIPGRNTAPCGSPGHTCDLHRQAELVEHYIRRRSVPTILWDKDRQLPSDHPLRQLANVTICEAALHPASGAHSLLFPVDDAVLDQADPRGLAASRRDLPLVYIGNQYDRDHLFDEFFAVPAKHHQHLVAGKWTSTQAWPHVTFADRVPFSQVEQLHRRALATVLLLPDRYAKVGQMTQRLPEAVLAGCLPLTPTAIRSAELFTPAALHVRAGNEASRRLQHLAAIAGTPEHAELIAQCLRKLDRFRVSRQLDTLEQILNPA